MEGLSFVKAERKSSNDVTVTYTLDDQKLEVVWNNIDYSKRTLKDYGLEIYCNSSDEALAERVENAIIEAESNNNADLDLYLYIRDTFGYLDCLDADYADGSTYKKTVDAINALACVSCGKVRYKDQVGIKAIALYLLEAHGLNVYSPTEDENQFLEAISDTDESVPGTHCPLCG